MYHRQWNGEPNSAAEDLLVTGGTRTSPNCPVLPSGKQTSLNEPCRHGSGRKKSEEMKTAEHRELMIKLVT